MSSASPIACAWCAEMRRCGALFRAGVLFALLLPAGCAMQSPAPHRATSARILLEERFPNRAYTSTFDDGQWVATRALEMWHYPEDPAELERELKEQVAAGYSIEEALLTVMPRAGLWAHAQLGSWKELRARVDSGCPVVVQQASGGRYGRRFLLVSQIDEERDFVRVARSDGVEEEQDVGVFHRAWQSSRQWMMTICPPDRVAWKMRTPELMSLVRYYDAHEDSDAAEKWVSVALENEPQNADLLTGIATRAQLSGRDNEAELLFRRALLLDDRHARAANNLALLLAERGRNLDEAAALSRRASALEPGNPNMLDTRGYILMKQQKWADARSTLEKAWSRSGYLPVSSRAAIGMHLARAYIRNDETHLARSLVRELLVESPGLLIPADVQAALAEPAINPLKGRN